MAARNRSTPAVPAVSVDARISTAIEALAIPINPILIRFESEFEPGDVIDTLAEASALANSLARFAGTIGPYDASTYAPVLSVVADVLAGAMTHCERVLQAEARVRAEG